MFSTELYLRKKLCSMIIHVCRGQEKYALLGLSNEKANNLNSIAYGAQNTYYSELLWLFVTILVLLLVGRALYVVPACWLHNLWSSEKVSVRDVVIIWCAASP